MNTQTSVLSRTNYVQLDSIIQGTQLNQRLQNAIFISYVHIDGSIQSNDTKTKFLRMMVVREINFGGVNTTTYSDLYKTTGNTVRAPNGTQLDGKWPLNRDLVYPLYDKTFKIKPETEGAVDLKRKIKIFKKVKYPIIDPSENNPVHGRLLLICNLYDADNAPNAVTTIMSYSLRVFFKDSNIVR